MFIAGSNTLGNVVAGNYIGTTATGLAGLGNGLGGVIVGDSAQGTLIGGSNAATRNIISGNDGAGVYLDSVTNNTIQGNYIGVNANGSGAVSNNFIGVYVVGGSQSNLVAGNVLSGNVSEGVRLTDAGTDWNTVQGNFCGTDPSGTFAIPNGFAGVNVQLGACSNLIGGTNAAARNILSGNFTAGVAVTDSGTVGNVVAGNYIGTDVTGLNTLSYTFAGVYLLNGAQNNTFGGASAGAGNVISANYYGMYIANAGTSSNLIQGNFIGVGADGTTALGNGFDGIILFDGASNNIIGLALDGSGAGNRIANNFSDAIRIDDVITTGNTIRGNSTYNNAGLGIELGAPSSFGVTTNDVGDSDVGPNNLQNFPTLTNALATSVSTVIQGILSSKPSHTYRLDFYSNTNADPSGFGEGQLYLGSVSVTTSSSGTNSFTFTTMGELAGQAITGTATDVTTGDTSEFSLAVAAGAGIEPPSFVGSLSLTKTGAVAKVWLTIGQSYHIRATISLTNPIPWVPLTNFTAAATNYVLVDKAATNLPQRFYQVVTP